MNSSYDHEHWLPILGFEGSYEVSDLGRVRSVDREIKTIDGKIVPRKGKIIKPFLTANGYERVRLCLGSEKRERRFVHHIVAYAFLGPRPVGADIRHLNDVKTDNRVSNLLYGTRSQNLGDAVSNGKHYWSARSKCSYGHEYNADNTRFYERRPGHITRVCRVCKRDRDRYGTVLAAGEGKDSN